MNTSSDRELVHSRTLNAPRSLVWEAWTDPKHLINWWGPRGFTNTFHEINIAPGGVWRFIMHGPDGKDWPNRVIFRDVVPPEKLTYLHDGDTNEENDPHRFEVVVTFDVNASDSNKTDVKMRMIVASAEALGEMKKFGAVEGGKQTLDKLEEELAAMINERQSTNN
jgi:uncharacterized protein YndB with AHSA1/START domain